MEFITLNPDNVMSEHLCCAISDKKHQTGVNDKRNWLSERVKRRARLPQTGCTRQGVYRVCPAGKGVGACDGG